LLAHFLREEDLQMEVKEMFGIALEQVVRGVEAFR